MILGIDHLVIIAPELNSSVANATQAGFTVTPGGTHADGITHNALIAFQDGTYIELIAPTGAQYEGITHRWFPRLAQGGGLVDICLASTNLADDVRAIRSTDHDYTGPDANGRKRPDGEQLRWKGAMPAGAVGERGWPFLIEDVTPREMRVSNDIAQTTHANGALGVAGVTMLVRDLGTATKDFEAITGRSATTMPSPMDTDPLAAFINFDHNWLMLTHPTAGDALHHLETVGAGPYAVALRTHDGPIKPRTGHKINPELMGGANFELV